MVYATAAHPDADGSGPWFQVRGGLVYPVRGAGWGAAPWFRIHGTSVYRADGHPDGPSRQPDFICHPAT